MTQSNNGGANAPAPNNTPDPDMTAKFAAAFAQVNEMHQMLMAQGKRLDAMDAANRPGMPKSPTEQRYDTLMGEFRQVNAKFHGQLAGLQSLIDLEKKLPAVHAATSRLNEELLTRGLKAGADPAALDTTALVAAHAYLKETATRGSEMLARNALALQPGGFVVPSDNMHPLVKYGLSAAVPGLGCGIVASALAVTLPVALLVGFIAALVGAGVCWLIDSTSVDTSTVTMRSETSTTVCT